MESVVAVDVDMKFEDVVIVVEVVMLVGEMVTRDVRVVDPGGGTGSVRVAVKESSDEDVGVGDCRHVPVMHRENVEVPPPPPPSVDVRVIDIRFPVFVDGDLASSKVPNPRKLEMKLSTACPYKKVFDTKECVIRQKSVSPHVFAQLKCKCQ